jgi:hypothetical protein
VSEQEITMKTQDPLKPVGAWEVRRRIRVPALVQDLIVIISFMLIIMLPAIEIPVTPFHFALLHSLCTPDSFRFVLISTAMALYTNLVVVNSFFHMLLADLGAGVLVAAVAGVVAVAFVYVTGTAFRCVVPVEAKVFFVIEGRRCPSLLGVARTAISLDLPVQSITWIKVATVALLFHGRFKQLM